MQSKKSLGQNFLSSKSIIDKIVRASGVGPGDVVLEIGPGKGALTEPLLATGAQVVAVELDERMIEYLQEKFPDELQGGQLTLLQEDILNFNESRLQEYSNAYSIVANIPYYVTGAILRKFLSSSHQPKAMTLIMQREVGDRIVARDGKESILSMSVKAYGVPASHGVIPARFFKPKPKVDSLIMRIDSISKGQFISQGISEEYFFTMVKAGFAHKRKQLMKNLKEIVAVERLADTFAALGLSPKIRAEDLTLGQWFLLAKTLQ